MLSQASNIYSAAAVLNTGVLIRRACAGLDEPHGRPIRKCGCQCASKARARRSSAGASCCSTSASTAGSPCGATAAEATPRARCTIVFPQAPAQGHGGARDGCTDVHAAIAALPMSLRRLDLSATCVTPGAVLAVIEGLGHLTQLSDLKFASMPHQPEVLAAMRHHWTSLVALDSLKMSYWVGLDNCKTRAMLGPFLGPRAVFGCDAAFLGDYRTTFDEL